MYQTLLSYIETRSTTPLTDGDIELIQSKFTPKKLRKGQYLLQAGEVCTATSFIVNGAMRQYSIDDRDVEHIIQLSIENWWAFDRESFLTLNPSRYYIDAWEDSTLLVLEKSNYYDHLIHVPAMVEMLASTKDNHANATQQRLHSALNDTAEQKYLNLKNAHPEFLQRFPMYLIASYLGITKETLSRLRRSN